MTRVESVLYPLEEDNNVYISVGVGEHGTFESDSVCITVCDGVNECEIYLSHEQSRKLSNLVTAWFLDKGQYIDD